mmetsp:Transcript_6562/g.16552  ORF Transcript_6562/g.16552 Transcript_6562/m.16552 type:complete len:486 (-) Transcript_6562:67-1524(-)
MAPRTKEAAAALQRETRANTKAASGLAASTREFTWEELAQHNTAKSAYIGHRGRVYDVTAWLRIHPGGRDTLILNAGRDSTQILESYHEPELLERMLGSAKVPCVGILTTHEHPTFRPLSQFYTETRRMVYEHLRSRNIDPHHSVNMLTRCLLLVLLLVGSHLTSVWLYPQEQYSLWWSYGLQVVVGVCAALLSLMPVHEASHFALTHSPAAWRLLGAIHDFVNGASFYNWLHQHFLGHHPYTSLEDIDPDIYTGDPDARRIKPSQGYLSMYRFQHLYVPPLYGVLSAKFRFNDLQLLFAGDSSDSEKVLKNGVVRVNPPESFHMACFVLGKLTWFAYRWVLPTYLIGWLPATLLLAVSDLVCSYYLAFVFQVNHVTRGLDWPKVGTDGVVDMDWAHMQVVTTIDYAHDSPLTTFLSGGLNYQAVHHLFPHVSQIYYPEIAPLVKAQCKKYGIQYKYKPTFWAALKDHLGYLYDMGQKNLKVHSH